MATQTLSASASEDNVAANEESKPNADMFTWKMENVNSRTEAFLAASGMSTFFLAFAIGDLQNGISGGGDDWQHIGYFWVYCICQSLAIGCGLFCTLIFSFSGFKMKRLQGTDHWAHSTKAEPKDADKCRSYMWYKNNEFEPFWHRCWPCCLCFTCTDPVSTMERIIDQSTLYFVSMFMFYIIAVIFYVIDTIEHIPVLMVVVISCIFVPFLMSVYILFGTRAYRIS